MKFIKIITIIIFSTFLLSCSNNKVYKVRKGDTLYSISKKKGVSINRIKEINSLKSNVLYPGQELYLKEISDTTYNKGSSYHLVQSGDTLYKISQKYNVSISELKKINNLKNNTLYKGDKIYLGKKIKSGNSGTVINNSQNTILKDFNSPLKSMVVNSPYGYRDHPILGRQILHTGVDLKAVMNTPVYSPYNGKVTYAGWMDGYGKIIIINHGNNYETRFAHLNRILIKEGEVVKIGQYIAKTGKTGRVTGPHLHYEIRYNKKTIDPMSLYR